MYASLGYEPPIFAHLPMILGSDRSKLSKRHGATSTIAYRDMGYLPEAMFNFLALLGWSLDDHTEIIFREDLVKHFTLERVSKTAAIFNPDKLNWMNGVYLREMEPNDFTDRLASFLERDLPAEVNRPIDRDYVAKIAPLVQERIKTLGDAAELTSFFFLDDLEYDLELFKGKKGKLEYDQAFGALDESLSRLRKLDSFDHDSLEGVLRPLASELGLKTGDLFGVIRVAITGRAAAPPLFETMSVLGRETTLARMEAALALSSSVSEGT
jgi:glutamyl-tRNA synthetase